MYLHAEKRQLVSFALMAVKNLPPQGLGHPKEFRKEVGVLTNGVKKGIRQQVVLPVKIANNEKPIEIVEQYQCTSLLHIDILFYMKKMGYSIKELLQPAYLDKDLYTQLMYVKLVLSEGGDPSVV